MPPAGWGKRILVVDDDASIRDVLGDTLAAEGASVVVASNGTEALAIVAKTSFDVVFSDVRMDEIDGLTLLRLLRERAPSVDVVLMSAYDDMPTVVAATRDGAVEFLSKPLDLHEVRAVLVRVLEDRRVLRRADTTTDLAFPDDGLVGKSPAMIGVYKLIGHSANSRATVLIRGESGTGKELVARAIHSNGANIDDPFVAVNCAALPSSLLESELFGHVRGAFTGAVNSRRGRFSQAGAGTIFLDEIGDTSGDFQSKLLRVLQDHEYQPVGAEEVERTDARVIAATHQDLEQMIVDRRFREDLYYRLRVVEIFLPPLRDRLRDIPMLADHVLRRAALALGGKVPILSSEVLERLQSHHWPGNVRELENCILRAAVLSVGGVLRAEHLSIASPRRKDAAPTQTLDEIERMHIVRVLGSVGGQKSKAAVALGVSRPRLNRLLQKHGLAAQ